VVSGLRWAVELFDFFKGRAKAYGVYDFVRLEHQVIGATWETNQGQWQVEVKNTATGEIFMDRAEVLINAGGFLKYSSDLNSVNFSIPLIATSKWKWPEIPGLESFKGHLVHSARWDDSYSFTNKIVAVIGSGSSAIQIVPKVQPGMSQ